MSKDLSYAESVTHKILVRLYQDTETELGEINVEQLKLIDELQEK